MKKAKEVKNREASSTPKKGKSQRKKILLQSFVLFFVFLILLLFIGINFLPKEPAIISTETPVFVSRSALRDIEDTYRLNGNVETEEMLTILPKISGVLVKLYVDVEDPVEVGQIVAEIDREPFELQLKQARAAWLAHKSTWTRIETLYRSGSTSQQQYDEAKARFDAAEAQYDLARLQLSYTQIRSDIEGVVLKRHDNINVGMLVASQVPIFTIGHPDKLIIEAKLPEQKYQYFKDFRSEVKIRIDIPTYNKVYNAHIYRISPYIEPQSKSFVVYCKFDDPSVSLPPGLSVKLTFVLDSRPSVFTVARKALAEEEYLWIAVPKTLYKPTRTLEELTDIKIDFSQDLSNIEWVAEKIPYVPTFSDSQFIMVDEILKDQLIITDGNDYLFSGQSVIIKNLHDEGISQ